MQPVALTDRCLRIGVIGPGEHAEANLLPPLRLLDDVRLAAISSRSLDRARRAAERWGAPWCSGDWRELVDSGQVDAVVVAAPPAVHFEVARHCLQRGIHVFVEKPPAPDAAALDELIALERARPDVVGFVGFNFPYGTSYRHLLDVVGFEGTIRGLRVRFVSRHPREPIWGLPSVEAGLLLSAGIHPIDMVLRLLGAPLDVHASVCRLARGILSLQLTIECAQGVGVVELGNYSNRLEYRCEVLAETGASGVLDQHNRLSFTGLTSASHLRGVAGGKEVVGYEWPSRRGGYERTGYQPMLESFRDAALRRGPGTSPLSACRASYQVIEQALAQLRGRPERHDVVA